MTKASRTFLVEIGVEEIPSRFLESLSDAYCVEMAKALDDARLLSQNPRVWSTPRRLVFQAEVAARQSVAVETVRGPALASAFQDGVATKALQGFLRRVGMNAEDLGRTTVGEKDYVTATLEKPVHSADEILPGLLDRVLASLPQPRSMRWGSDDVRFIRPVRWVVAVLDEQVLEGQAFGVAFGKVTYGNRTDHPGALLVSSVSDYWKALIEGNVTVDVEQRRRAIRDQGQILASQSGGVPDWDPTLLEEVVNLIEWPTPFLGEMDPKYLDLPEPILVTSMRVHQRYFPIRGPNNRLLPYFLAVRNGIGEDLDAVRHGNQRVLAARLADAQYFYDLDRKSHLVDHAPDLSGVTLHAKLGTYHDKIERLGRLFLKTRTWWTLDAQAQNQFERALRLFKCDLLTQVVGEFPELQGEMGGIYAALDGEEPVVAQAIQDQYRPLSADDVLPQGTVGQVLGLLDRVDTLVSFYDAGMRASGSEDPFGLRRQAMGIARLASETAVLNGHTVIELLDVAIDAVGAQLSVKDEVYALIVQRLVSQWEGRWPKESIQAVLAREFPWHSFVERLRFLDQHGVDRDDVVAAYKRISRILANQVIAPGRDPYEGIEEKLAVVIEKVLATPPDALDAWWDKVQDVVPVVTEFFDRVLVMDPDSGVRLRRLRLLASAKEALGRYYDWEAL